MSLDKLNSTGITPDDLIYSNSLTCTHLHNSIKTPQHNNMKVIIAGSTGMIGNLVLEHCLNSNQITNVISLVRKLTDLEHGKLQEVIITNFEDHNQHLDLFSGVSAAYFCLGAYTGAVPDELFKKITVDYAISFAKALEQQSPNCNLCLLSGQGADRTEKSKTPFARYKGMAENALSNLNVNFHSFRPGYIYPVTLRNEPNLIYKIFRLLYPLLKLMGKKYSITSTQLSKAMFIIGIQGSKQKVYENHEILEILKQD